MARPSSLDKLSVEQIEALLEKRRSQEHDSKRKELADAKAKVKELEAYFSGKKTRKSRKAGTSAAPKAKGKRGKRGALGEAILKFLTTKGKEGAHVKDIAAEIKHKPANVTAYFYGTGKKVKGVKKHGGNVFSYVAEKE